MGMEELPKSYNPKEVEDKIYKLWRDSGFFTPEKTKKTGLKGWFQKKFVTAIAPPNITGELHMGHALEYILQDIIVRMKRMQGFEVLWIPGLDHAGIAAQNVVEKELKKEGLNRHDLGKEKFLERMWQWMDKYGGKILEQFKKLGVSVDWSRKRFTMDENYQKAVSQAFNHYKAKGWIYQGHRVINWCPRCQSSISDLEVEYKETKGKLYFIKYEIVNSKECIIVATTRPETMLGDTAVAVNPNDERYKNLIGRKSILPIQERKIPIIADESVDMHFGTGAVKVTPAHSFEDFEISQRHNLKVFEVIDKYGKMTKDAGPICEGLKTDECRQKVVEKLKELGLLEKEEDLIHNIGHCERCGTAIEPLYSKQWFLKMKELAELAKKAVKNGSVKIHPQKWEDDIINWLADIRDWNISRQLWWGHKIPIKNEEDILDTWFSSALWPFAVLGWPDKNNPDYKNFYPTQYITSARDIRYLWQTRMIFSGLELTGKAPFKDVYIHATVLTKDGKRMSKSLGTGIDPIQLIEKYGADALRFGLASQATKLQDLKFGEDLMVMGRKFSNKLWNIARYVLMKTGDGGQWKLKNPHTNITAEIDGISTYMTKNIEDYNFAEAANAVYKFVWHEFADKYIEETKNKDDNKIKESLIYVLTNSLKLLHPFMPFITEEIWSKLPIRNKKLLLIENWPY
jgi:valyl-tRNA synthetase